MSDANENYVSKGEVDKLLCEVCSITFQTESKLEAHNKFHDSTSRKFQCRLCPKLYKTDNDRNRHEREYHNTEPVECVCKKMFKHKRSLMFHKKKSCSMRQLAHSSVSSASSAVTSEVIILSDESNETPNFSEMNDKPANQMVSNPLKTPRKRNILDGFDSQNDLMDKAHVVYFDDKGNVNLCKKPKICLGNDLECDICKVRFLSQENLSLHMKQIHSVQKRASGGNNEKEIAGKDGTMMDQSDFVTGAWIGKIANNSEVDKKVMPPEVIKNVTEDMGCEPVIKIELESDFGSDTETEPAFGGESDSESETHSGSEADSGRKSDVESEANNSSNELLRDSSEDEMHAKTVAKNSCSGIFEEGDIDGAFNDKPLDAIDSNDEDLDRGYDVKCLIL